MGNRLTLLLCLVAVLLAGGAVLWLSGGERGAESPSALPAPGTAPSTAEPRAELVEPDEISPAPSAPDRPSRVEVAGDPAPKREDPAARAGGELRLRGRVVDRFDAPIAGARLIAARSAGFPIDLDSELDLPWMDRRRTETDASGAFELSGLEPGPLRLAVRAHGFAPLDKDGVRLPSEGTVELEPLVLARGAILTGIVVDPSGRGVAGAKLVRQDPASRGAFFFGAQRSASAVTAADGTFRIDELACGPWRFLVRTEEHPDLFVEGIAEQPAVETPGLRWQLAPGAAISGQVVDVPAEERGKLEVRAVRAGGSAEPFGSSRAAAVDASGAFSVRGLEPGQLHELQARRAERSSDFWERSRSQSATARAGDSGVVLSYQPEAAVAFQVLDSATRAPITDFQVEAGIDWPRPQRDEDGRLRTLYPEGRVRIGGLRPSSADERVQLVLRATGYRELRRADIAVQAGQELDLGPIFLDPVPLVRVRVLDGASGAPVAGALVRLEKDLGDRMEIRRSIQLGDDDGSETVEIGGTRSAKTDERGLAELTSFEGETCRLTVRSDEHAPFQQGGLFLPAGEVVVQEVRLTPGGEVLVHARDAEGLPLAGARVAHRGSTSSPGGFRLGGGKEHVTDSEGEVLFRNLEAGVHSFRLDDGAPDGAFFGDGEEIVIAGLGEDGAGEDWTEVQVTEGGRSEINLVASPRGAVSGRVREAGKLLAGATLRLTNRDEDEEGPRVFFPGMDAGQQARTDGEGRYRIDEVKEGSYLLAVEHPTRRMPQEFPLEVRAGENVFDVDLSLSVIEGRALDQEGKPLSGVRVRAERVAQEGPTRTAFMVMIDDGGGGLFNSGELGRSSTTTDAEGRYSLRGVMSDVDLVVKAEGDTVQPGSSEVVRVEPDETRRGVDLELEAAGAIAVEAALADGTPARFCIVNATYADGEAAGVEPKFAFMQSGATTLKGLKPGTWRVNVRRAGPNEEESPGGDQEIEVKAGETASATFRLD